MNVRLALLGLVVLGCAPSGRDRALDAPSVHEGAEMAKIVRTEGYRGRLSLEGVAFVDSVLFVATNVGLLEVQGPQTMRLDTWFATDNVVSGPWLDRRTGRLWLKREHDEVFLQRDAGAWKKIAFPTPPSGDYTRGDILEGFRGVSDSAHDFHLVGAGNVWRWSDSSQWGLVASPSPDSTFRATIAYARLGARELFVTSTGSCSYLPCTNQAHWFVGGAWRAPIALGVGEVSDVVATRDGIFIRAKDGKLFRVDSASAPPFAAPGPCEAIAVTSAGRLLAFFRGSGIYELEGAWKRSFDDPTSPSGGEQWAHLAERYGTVALATSTVPQIDVGSGKMSESGEVGLWLSAGGRLARILPLSERP